MPEPLMLRCCCGHARRSHIPRWTWHLLPGHGLQRQPDAPGACRHCACGGYYAPLAQAAASPSSAADHEA
jgi:hypothetical protein